MRAALYVRVSTQEQKNHGASVENQIQALTEYCENNKISNYTIYNDAGLSGHASYKKRPALLKLISDCQAGAVDIILFTRIDRWFRSIKDYYLVMEQINGVPWRAIWEDYNTQTSDGQFKVNIMLSISEAEAARTSEKEKSVLAHLKSQGIYHGSCPFGYRMEKGHLYIIPEMVPMMNEIYDTYLATRSSSNVMKILIQNGYNVSINTVKRILSSTTYCGDANGVPCEAYITKEKYNQIQSVKKMWGRTDTRREYTFRGICRCKICGRKLSSKHATVHGKVYNSYSCKGWEGTVKHKGFAVSEIKLERYLLSCIEDEMEKYNAEIESDTKKEDREKEIANLEKRLYRIGIRYEDGDISTEEYRKKTKDIKERIRELSAEVPVEPVNLPEGWRAIYDDMSKTARREFWSSSIKQIMLDSKDVSTCTIEWL